MSLRNDILNKIVKPADRTYYDTVQATVISYDELNNKATIQFQDPRGAGLMELNDVPVQLGSGGLHSSGPFPGDSVWVSFGNRNPLYPKIVALCDDEYTDNTRERYKHTRQGGCCPNDLQEHEINTIVPITAAWFKSESIPTNMYYKTSKPLKELSSQISQVGYYGSSEPGITHPLNNSTIKVSDDGSIFIFTDVGTGIKIDPNSNTVNIFGGRAVHQNEDTLFSSNTWTINCEKEVTIKARGNITLDSEEEIRMYAKEFRTVKKEG